MEFGKKSRAKRVILEAQRDKKKVHFATLMDICHLKNAELDPKIQKYKGRIVFRRDIAKDDSGAYVFYEQGSSVSQMMMNMNMNMNINMNMTTLSGSRSPTTDPRQASMVTSCRRCSNRSRAQVVCPPRQVRMLTQNLLHEFCLELFAVHVGPRLVPDREPVTSRFRWRQISGSRWSCHLRELDS